jgi:hypothetical protein
MRIRDLYQSRCAVSPDGNLKPTFWKPQPLAYYPICFYASTDQLADESAIGLVQRLISIALKLEVEVGEFVLSGLKRELPKADKELPLLLKSNASDESRHFLGFKYASEVYGKADDSQLESLVSAWIELADSDKSHPIQIAGLLETSIFLIGLGLLRIVGSPSLTRLSLAVAEDEYRHVQTNVAVSSGLGFWNHHDSYTQELIDSTIEWMWGNGVNGVPDGISLQHLKRYSRELVAGLESRDFDSLTWYSTHHLPFELQNSYMYDSRETDSSF